MIFYLRHTIRSVFFCAGLDVCVENCVEKNDDSGSSPIAVTIAVAHTRPAVVVDFAFGAGLKR